MEETKSIPYNPQELYNVRLLVLIESEPQSDKYRQILLTKEQFLSFSFLTRNLFPTDLRVSDQLIKMPDLKEWI